MVIMPERKLAAFAEFYGLINESIDVLVEKYGKGVYDRIDAIGGRKCVTQTDKRYKTVSIPVDTDDLRTCKVFLHISVAGNGFHGGYRQSHPALITFPAGDAFLAEAIRYVPPELVRGVLPHQIEMQKRAEYQNKILNKLRKLDKELLVETVRPAILK